MHDLIVIGGVTAVCAIATVLIYGQYMLMISNRDDDNG